MNKLVCFLALASACQVPPPESQTPTGTLGTNTKPSLTCPEDYTACGNICVDADNDPRHCGACNNACEAGALCLAGSCRAGPGQRRTRKMKKPAEREPGELEERGASERQAAGGMRRTWPG